MLDHFPRPANDNGRGVHWSHDSQRWGKPDWGFWQEQILALNIKWVKMLDTGDGSSIGLAKRLIDIGVMPVVRFYRLEPNPDPISSREIEAARQYIDWGVVYFETNNEPDLTLEWKNKYRPDNWLEIVVDNFIFEASAIRDMGGYLLFPAFGPGGRGNPFQLIVERGRQDILDGNCGLAIHNYCLGRPLDYPNDAVNMAGAPLTQQEWVERGGMWAWEMDYQQVNQHRRELANPHASIMEDSTCFRAFEYFDKLVNDAVGHSIPIFTTEGGYNVGQRAGTTAGDDPRYPKPTPEWTGRLTEDMFDYLQTEGPDYYFACMPWLIAVSRIGNLAPPYEQQGPWYTHQFDQQFGLNGELPTVPKLKALPSVVRADGPQPNNWARYQVDWDGRNVDNRLKYLEPQPSLQSVGTQVPMSPYWRLSTVQWADRDEGGIGYIFVKALDENGTPIEQATFQVERPNHADQILTKGQADDFLGDYQMTAGLGTYRVSMAHDDLPSDVLADVGRGNEENPSPFDNTSFFLTFQKIRPYQIEDTVLPVAASLAPHGVAFAPSGYRLAVSGYQSLELWDLPNEHLLQTFIGHNSWVGTIRFSPTDSMLVSTSWDKTVRLWDVESGQERAKFQHNSWVSGVDFSPDESSVVTIGADKTVYVWDIDSQQLIRQMQGHQFHGWAVAFHAQGRWIASGSGDKTVRLWDIYSGQEIQRLTGHTRGVLDVAFSPTGDLLASASNDGFIKLWQVNTGQEIRQIDAGSSAVYSIAFSPDGQRLASGQMDHTVKLWQVETGQALQTFVGHKDIVRQVAFSPTGDLLASTSADKTVRLWALGHG
ncbi:WD40 repeat domain-containing protein [Anaerolineales bacterium HSG25]|nr:WD40 repeat domain-containing protein [Anaerolineales bacterium HSG25]